MIKTIPFKAEHIECMNIRQYEMDTCLNMPYFQMAIKIWQEQNRALTMLCDGRIIAIAGYVDMWNGVCEVFVLPSIYLKEYPHAFARCVRKILKSGMFNSYNRVQLRSLDDETHNRFNKFCGFTKEAVLKKYDPFGNDMGIWAVTKGGI